MFRKCPVRNEYHRSFMITWWNHRLAVAALSAWTASATCWRCCCIALHIPGLQCFIHHLNPGPGGPGCHMEAPRCLAQGVAPPALTPHLAQRRSWLLPDRFLIWSVVASKWTLQPRFPSAWGFPTSFSSASHVSASVSVCWSSLSDSAELNQGAPLKKCLPPL